MNMRRQCQLYLGLILICTGVCVFGLLGVATAQAGAGARVLLVTGTGVSADAQAALGSAIAAHAELLDSRDYQRMTRSQGLLPTSDLALERIAPRAQAHLIVVAKRSGRKLVVKYLDGRSGAVLKHERFSAVVRGRSRAARLRSRLARSVRGVLASLPRYPAPAQANTQPSPSAWQTSQPVNVPNGMVAPQAPGEQPFEPLDEAQSYASTPEDADNDADASSDAQSAPRAWLFELSAGLGGGMRATALPTRLGVHQLNTGLFPGAALGLCLGVPIGSRGLLRATVDYRTSIGLQGVEMQRATEMSTPLRSHGVGFGLAPGFRFGGPDSASLHLHVGWYFRGLRPIAQLALPAISWHGAMVRPELYIPISGGIVTLRLAPELVIVAGVATTLADQTGIARSGTGFGAEASVDIRVAEPVSIRIEYTEMHVAVNTAWAQNFTDVQRFADVRVVLHY